MQKFPILISTLLVLNASGFDEDFSTKLNTIKSLGIKSEQQSSLEVLKVNNKLPIKRPEFCPLNTTMTYKKTIDSLKALTAVFEDDCLDSNQSLVGQLLENSKSLEADLNALAEQQGKETTNNVKTLDDIEVDGIPVSQLMMGMDTLLNSNKCSNINRKSFLERSADVIQTFSQIGLYSDEGAKYAFGGLAFSSILRFVNNIFEKRFEFTDEADIQTFIKLNCSYYDIRNEITSQEIFDVDTTQHYRDKLSSEELKVNLGETLSEYEESLESIRKTLEQKQAEYLEKIGENLYQLSSELLLTIPDKIIDTPGKSGKYQQAEVIGLLSFQLDLINSTLSDYIEGTNGPDKFLNMLFKNKLQMLYAPEELMSLTVDEFNKTFLNDVTSSFKRVIRDIEKKRTKGIESFDSIIVANINGTSFKVSDVKSYLESDEKIEKESKFNEFYNEVKSMDQRLERFVNRNDYSNKDSSNGGVRDIVKYLDIARNYVYGKFGREFLDSMKERANIQNKNFVDRFVKIQERYLDKEGRYLRMRPKSEFNEEELRYACADFKVVRELWVYSQSLSELAYDFLETNHLLFGDPAGVKDRKKITKYYDSTKLARKIISSLNYQKKLKNYIEIHGETYTIEQAKKIVDRVVFNGRTYTIEEAKEFLYKEFGSEVSTYNYLGPVILDIALNKPRVIFIQDLHKEYECDGIKSISE